MSPAKPIINVVNVVATARVHQQIDLEKVVRTFEGIQYDPSRFPGLVFRIDRPKTSTLIFRTGGMVCTGAKSDALARLAVNTVVKRLRKGGIKIKGEPVVHIQNIVAAVTLGNRIKFEEFVKGMPRIIYEPEQFPGA
ncbi:MAG: TATA box-binding protein, partial [Nitrososphaerales archaeon]